MEPKVHERNLKILASRTAGEGNDSLLLQAVDQEASAKEKTGALEKLPHKQKFRCAV